MVKAKTRASEAIRRAQAELARAINEIETIHTFDPAVVGLMAHALDNYTTVTAATVEMLQLALRDHEDGDVGVWLKGIGRATELMSHSIGRLVSLAPSADFQLSLDAVSLTVLMDRACEYYRRRAGVSRSCAAASPNRRSSGAIAWRSRLSPRT
jgi:hypothetical protein